MGVPNSVVGYTPAMPTQEGGPQGHVVALGKKNK